MDCKNKNKNKNLKIRDDSNWSLLLLEAENIYYYKKSKKVRDWEKLKVGE